MDVNSSTGLIVRLIGVYDADATLRGELAYWIGARLGRAHCGLCDITHGIVRERPDWQQCRDGLPVPFDLYHRDDQPANVRQATKGRAPAVVAETAVAMVELLAKVEVDACSGSPHRLTAAIEAAVGRRGLHWTGR